MIIVHRNMITDRFIQESIKKLKSVEYKKINAQDLDIIDKVRDSIMYYDHVMLEISTVYDYKTLLELYKQESNEIRIIAVFDKIDDYKKAKSLMMNKDKTTRCIEISSIQKELVLIYLNDIFSDVYGKKMKNTIIDKIYLYLKYKVNINKEIATIASMRTQADLLAYVSRKFKVNSSNFAENLITGKNIKEVSKYLLEYSGSMNYLHTILHNYVDLVIDIYEIWRNSEELGVNIGDLYLDNKSIQKKVQFTSFLKIVKISKSQSYAYWLHLKQRIENSSTKLQKQLIILELL